MSELNKRFFTSILLISLVFLCLYNQLILVIFLFLVFLEIIYEFNILLKKIFKRNKKVLFFLILLIIFINSYSIFYVWLTLSSDIYINKIKLFLIVITTISTDIGGYIFGKLLKGKKLSKLSPNKTYSGMFGSYIMSTFITYLFFRNIINLNELIIYTLIISTISQIGDLLISFLKRKANIKDTGSILPGHGGVLDRLDGLLLAIPIGLIFLN